MAAGGQVKPFSVSGLTNELSSLVRAEFEDVWVEGEVSQFKVQASGHWYFCLKDPGAVLNCAMFRGQNMRLRRQPREGEKIHVRGHLDVYAPRGSYSLIVNDMKAAGAGDAAARLAALKAKLQAEGLFDVARKRTLPRYPKAIGVATSGTGAAYVDIRRVLTQRHPGVSLYLAPCKVQGEGAAEEIAAAIALLNAHGKSDVIIVGRGGGSAEDLSAFNAEVLVRAVVNSRIPVVSAVGHEVDICLCDLAADVRAATPSHAAETVVPVRMELVRTLQDRQLRMGRALARRMKILRDRLRRLRLLHPSQRVERGRLRAAELEERMEVAMGRLRQLRRERLLRLARNLHALSPLAVLGRGYAVVRFKGRLVTDSAAVTVGERVEVDLRKGRLVARVEE